MHVGCLNSLQIHCSPVPGTPGLAPGNPLQSLPGHVFQESVHLPKHVGAEEGRLLCAGRGQGKWCHHLQGIPEIHRLGYLWSWSDVHSKCQQDSETKCPDGKGKFWLGSKRLWKIWNFLKKTDQVLCAMKSCIMNRRWFFLVIINIQPKLMHWCRPVSPCMLQDGVPQVRSCGQAGCGGGCQHLQVPGRGGVRHTHPTLLHNPNTCESTHTKTNALYCATCRFTWQWAANAVLYNFDFL